MAQIWPGLSYPKIAYALPSLLASVIKATEPRATPTAPANMPCKRRIEIACWIVVAVPKLRQVRALPRSEMISTERRPCLSATVACISFNNIANNFILRTYP